MLFCVILLLIVNNLFHELLTIKQGILRGRQKKSTFSGKEYYSYMGIPYAKPPIGDLRFRPPQPPDNWIGIRDANIEGKVCLQPTVIPPVNVCGSEDCLYLNVFVPEPPKNIRTLKPVMVYIHGGSFTFNSGSPMTYAPDYLISYDVVLVTFNYRLNVLGFLNLNLPECSGNVGLKDQVAVLIWVKNNIKHFGGDPSNVTLFGQSAGATSVFMHMHSPLSKGLFNKCIIQSAIHPQYYLQNPELSAIELCKHMGYEGNGNLNDVLAFLKMVPGHFLVLAFISFQKVLKQKYPGSLMVPIPFYPSIERISNGAFLPKPIDQLRYNVAKVPVICGFTNLEGLLCTMGNSLQHIASYDYMKQGFVMQHAKRYKTGEAKANIVFETLADYYSLNGSVSQLNIDKVVDFYTDSLLWTFYGNLKNVIERSNEESPVYLYRFSYDSNLNIYKKSMSGICGCKLKGAAHTDDTVYLFHDCLKSFFPPSPADRQMVHTICSMWTSFAKTGSPNFEPNINWNRTRINDQCYAEIDNNGVGHMSGKINDDRFNLWEILLEDS